MSDREQVNFLVDGDRKAEWEAHVEDDPNVESLSQLIRLATSQYVSGDLDVRGGGGAELTKADFEAAIAPDHDEWDAMKRRVKRIEDSVENIEDSVVAVEEEVTSVSGEADTMVFDALPRSREGAITVEGLADKLGWEHEYVHDAGQIISRLEERVGRVKSTETSEGDVVYWKEAEV